MYKYTHTHTHLNVWNTLNKQEIIELMVYPYNPTFAIKNKLLGFNKTFY